MGGEGTDKSEIISSLHEIKALSSDLSLTQTLTEDEQLSIQLKLWRYLGKRTSQYTMLDSTSVPIETAQELLSSICFVLEEAMGENAVGPKQLLTEDIGALFTQGQKIIESKLEHGRKLWEEVRLGTPAIDNFFFRDTLKGIGNFFKRYDRYYFAHQIPCVITYELCLPVPETLLGIEYVTEYLKRIAVENLVLQAFSRQSVIGLLERISTDYADFHLNLCEPVIINATGLLMAGKSPFGLDISDTDRKKIIALLTPLPEIKARAVLSDAAGRLCEAVGIREVFAVNYITEVFVDICPRLFAALGGKDISNVFRSITVI